MYAALSQWFFFSLHSCSSFFSSNFITSLSLYFFFTLRCCLSLFSSPLGLSSTTHCTKQHRYSTCSNLYIDRKKIYHIMSVWLQNGWPKDFQMVDPRTPKWLTQGLPNGWPKKLTRLGVLGLFQYVKGKVGFFFFQHSGSTIWESWAGYPSSLIIFQLDLDFQPYHF